MVLKLFNLYYFFFIGLGVVLFSLLYVFLRKKSPKFQYYFLGGLLLFNLALHFIKLSFHPYTTHPEIAMSQIWFVNMCAVSILVFPFIYFGKNKTLKDFMFYLGLLSGLLAIIMPIDNLGRPAFWPESIRFYLAHYILLFVPLLMIVLKLHTISYKRIWAMPFLVCVYLLFIMVQNVLQSEMGIIDFRNDDFFNPNFHNPTFVWGPTDELAKLFSIFTPDFMKIVPWGPHKGEVKYWPFFWLVPGAFVYFWSIPLIFNLVIPYSRKALFNDLKAWPANIKKMFRPKALPHKESN